MKIKILLLILLEQLKGFYIMNPFIIYSMAYHETGGFTSDIFKENKNLFGMKQAQIRENTAIATSRGHAVYKSLSSSIKDFILRQKYFGVSPNSNFEEYAQNTLNTNYAEDNNYLPKWRNHYENVKGSSVYIYVSLLLIPIIVYYVYKYFK